MPVEMDRLAGIDAGTIRGQGYVAKLEGRFYAAATDIFTLKPKRNEPRASRELSCRKKARKIPSVRIR